MRTFTIDRNEIDVTYAHCCRDGETKSAFGARDIGGCDLPCKARHLGFHKLRNRNINPTASRMRII
jgi:hypothetical protein